MRPPYDGPSADGETPQALPELVSAYQRDHTACADEQHPALRQNLHNRMRLTLEALYAAMRDDLLKEARRWSRSRTARAIWESRAGTASRQEIYETIAQSMMLEIIEALPGIVIDPNRQLQGLLIIIARRGMIGQERKEALPAMNLSQLLAVDDEQRVGAQELTDVDSLGADVTWAAGVDLGALYVITSEFVSRTSTTIDQQIFEARCGREQALSFVQIADRLGAGWTATTVRQRHLRLLKRIRTYLKSLGWNGY